MHTPNTENYFVFLTCSTGSCRREYTLDLLSSVAPAFLESESAAEGERGSIPALRMITSGGGGNQILFHLALVRVEFVRGRMSGCFQFRPPTLRKHLECETVVYRSACMQVSRQATFFCLTYRCVYRCFSVCSNSNQVTHQPILNI